MSKPTVMVVSHDYYGTEAFMAMLREKLGDTAEVFAAYRVYRAEEAALHADIIVGDGTCKDYAAELERAVPVRYNTARLARRHGKMHIGRFPGGVFDRTIAGAVAMMAGGVNKRKALVV